MMKNRSLTGSRLERVKESEINSVSQRSSARVRTSHVTSEEGRRQGSRGKEVKQEREGECVCGEGVTMGREGSGGTVSR